MFNDYTPEKISYNILKENRSLTRLEEPIAKYNLDLILGKKSSQTISFPYEGSRVIGHIYYNPGLQLTIEGKNMSFYTKTKNNKEVFTVVFEKFTINEAKDLKQYMNENWINVIFGRNAVSKEKNKL